MEDDYSMSERILRTIENIIESDTELKEFAIVPSGNTKNKSPVIYVEHNLGLESWCVKHIYRYVCSTLFELKEALVEKRLPSSKMYGMNRLLMGALLINPDVNTFWNMRRQLVEYDVLNTDKEMYFTKIVLTHKSKSNEAFSYRRWLLQRYLLSVPEHNVETMQRLLQEELAETEVASENAPNNYYSWTHRIWSLEKIGYALPNIGNIVFNELQFSFQWISSHISEHTGFHYRQHLYKLIKEHRHITSAHIPIYYITLYSKKLLKLLSNSDKLEPNILIILLGKLDNCRVFEQSANFENYFVVLLCDIFFVIDSLNETYPGHEALWYHRRYIIYHLLEAAYEYYGLEFKVSKRLCDYHANDVNVVVSQASVCVNFTPCNENGEKQPKLFKSQQNRVETSHLYEVLLDTEKKFISKNYLSKSSVQIDLARKYERWLKYIVGFEID